MVGASGMVRMTCGEMIGDAESGFVFASPGGCVSLGWSVRREGWYKLRSGVYKTYKSTVQNQKQSLSKEGQKKSNAESQQPWDCCRV